MSRIYKDISLKSLAWCSLLFFVSTLNTGYSQPRSIGVPTSDRVSHPYLEKHKDIDIEIDGVLSESFWSKLEPIRDWYQQSPNEGGRPSETTVMRITYDDQAFYLSAEVFETNTSNITSKSLERDSYSKEEDGIGLILDTSNDERTAYGFIVTPAGVRTDIAISNNANSQWNQNWDTFWTAATTKTDQGWNVEMRIPFSSVRFEPSSDKEVTMGMILWRYMARSVEYDVYPKIPNKWDNSAFKPSEARKITLENIRPKNPFYLKPYVLTGLKQEQMLSEDAANYQLENEIAREIGLDLKYNLTSSLVLDVTANTDFAQVEADDEQVNTSRFSLFLPEKRDFFQERADLFEFRFPGGPQRVFQSRKIGIYDGRLVPIIGGVRLTGSLNSFEVGMLNMQTGSTVIGQDDIPSENFGVFRVQRNIFNEASYVGGMFTSRTDFNGNYNLVYAADTEINIWDDDYIAMQFAQSIEPDAILNKSNTVTFLVQRRINKGFSFGTSFKHVGESFNPAVGFLQRSNIKRWGTRLRYTWFPEASKSIQNYMFTYRFEFIWDPGFSMLETQTNRLTTDLLFLSGASLQFEMRRIFEDLTESFSVGNISVAPARYQFWAGGTKFSTPSGRPLKIEAGFEAGGYFGGKQFSGSFSPTWIQGPHLSLSVDYLFNRLDVRGGTFNAHITRFRVAAALNKQLTASSYIQYNSGESLLSPNIRIRYNPKEGSDLYIVYSEGINLDTNPRDRLDPRLPRMQARSILVKYTYTFNI